MTNSRWALPCALGIVLLPTNLWAADAEQPDAAFEPPADSTSNDEHDDMRFGVIAGVGFPHPIAVEGMMKIADWVAIGFEYGVLPTSSFGSVDLSMQSYAADARFFPFRGAFFVGARMGYQSARASAVITVGSASSEQTLNMTSWYVNPRLGILWTSKPGFTIGTELGLQIPMAARTSGSNSLGIPVELPENPIATLNRSVLPTVDVLRLGWLF